MRGTRFLASWALYLIGDGIYRLFDHKWGPEWYVAPLYRAYSYCMGLSDRIQGDGAGPWSDPKGAVE